jgi:hypothetical protein
MNRSVFAAAVSFALLLASAPLFGDTSGEVPNMTPSWVYASAQKLRPELVAKYGEAQTPRIDRGLKQVAELWRTGDGDDAAFEDFVRANFAGDQKTLDELFGRMSFALESLSGHMLEIGRDFRRQSDLDLGPIHPFDEALAGYDPSAHVTEDFFRNKLAFTVLLNFPLTRLEERLANGEKWTRRQWAEARLAQMFSRRLPADVALDIANTESAAGQYIAQYNVWMHHLVDSKGRRLFPPKKRLLSHWNLRDEIKADYADKTIGLAKQREIAQVMERIVTQTIPQSVIDNPGVDWNPKTNEVRPAAVTDSDKPPAKAPVSAAREPDTRYATLLANFRAERRADPYSPNSPTLIDRRFNDEREIPEARVRQMFEQILTSPLVPRVAALIRKRLGRPLEPFDIWYSGFRPSISYSEADLDSIVRKRYPSPAEYKADIPNLLMKLGFSRERAEYVANNIVVDPARGSGHALGAQGRWDKAHLRTRVGTEGMDYKGYNIAVHEMGHNVEQTFSLNTIDYWLLNGVPNNAFTEALAFVFQGHDLELLGLTKPDETTRALKTLDDFWGAYEIAGVSLVDMAVWHYMYDHPNATPAELREATIAIAKDVWNRYYAPVFNERDVVLLGIYSHMIELPLYLPDYPIGHMIAFQVEQQMEKAGAIGPEFERVAKIGRVTPDLWMKEATGAPVGPQALLTAAERSVEKLESNRK